MAFLFSSPKTSPETAGAAAEPEVALRYPKLNAAAVKALDLQHSLIMTPLTSPEMELPYLVRQAGGVLGCDKHISRSGRPHYYLVSFWPQWMPLLLDMYCCSCSMTAVQALDDRQACLYQVRLSNSVFPPSNSPMLPRRLERHGYGLHTWNFIGVSGACLAMPKLALPIPD